MYMQRELHPAAVTRFVSHRLPHFVAYTLRSRPVGPDNDMHEVPTCNKN